MTGNVQTAHPRRVNEKWRERIRTSMLINRLQDHVVGKVQLSSTQIQAAKILLSKVAPDLSQVDGYHSHSHEHQIRSVEIAPVKALNHTQPNVLEGEYEQVQAIDNASEMLIEK